MPVPGGWSGWAPWLLLIPDGLEVCRGRCLDVDFALILEEEVGSCDICLSPFKPNLFPQAQRVPVRAE